MHGLLLGFLWQVQGTEQEGKVGERAMNRASYLKLNPGALQILVKFDPCRIFRAVVGSAELHERLAESLTENGVEKSAIEIHASANPGIRENCCRRASTPQRMAKSKDFVGVDGSRKTVEDLALERWTLNLGNDKRDILCSDL